MKLNALFSDHMVFQANKPIRVFGRGKGTVEVAIAGKHKTLVSEEDTWCVELDSEDYGGPYALTVTLGGEKHLFTDVYFGDVFLLAGQSNLQYKLRESPYTSAQWKDNPLLRFFMTERLEIGESLFPSDGFSPCQIETMGGWSAVGYHMAQMLNEDTGHAVGIIGCYQGASLIQSWIEKGAVDAAFNDQARPLHKGDNSYMWNRDGALYEKQLLSIAPFSMQAVVWYQGESNTHDDSGQEGNYLLLLKALIETWRHTLQDAALDFLVIEIADFIQRDYGPDCLWRQVQAAQRRVAEVADRAVCIPCKDICENDDIHPPTKAPLARRIVDYIEQNL